MENLNNSLVTYSIFLDYKKAFDTVSHSILLNKLTLVGLNTRTCNWFKSYLTNRKQRVCINGTLSSLETITYGVPQGSVLGPLLFLVYINDLPKAIPCCSTTLYADNAVISCTDYRVMKNALVNLSKWCKNNSLTPNETKTVWMQFGK